MNTNQIIILIKLFFTDYIRSWKIILIDFGLPIIVALLFTILSSIYFIEKFDFAI